MRSGFIAIAAALFIASLALGVFAADPGHGASSIGTGTFESGNYSFPDTLEILRGLNVSNGLLYVDPATNNVGIGTTAPFFSLQVGTSTGIGLTNDASGDLIGQTGLAFRPYDPSYIGAGIFGKQVGTYGVDLLFGTKGFGGMPIYERMRITNAGNVGIGTTGPAQKLNVEGSANITGDVFLSTTGLASCSGKLITDSAGNITCGTDATGSGGMDYTNVAMTNQTNTFTPNQTFSDSAFFSNSVGIGTTNPSYQMHIVGVTGVMSSATGLAIEGTGTGARVWKFTPTASDTLLIGIPGVLRVAALGPDGSFYAGGLSTDAGGQAKFFVNGTSGNVGIGTTGPTSQLDIGGSSAYGLSVWETDGGNAVFTVLRDSAQGILDLYDRGGNGGSVHLQARNSGVSYFNGGNVGIGTTNPQASLDVKSSSISNWVQRWVASDGSALGYLYESAGGAGALYLNDAAGTIKNLLTTDGGNSYLNSGNVGIGTTAPSGKLTVDAASAGVYVADAARTLILHSTDTVAADLGSQIGFSGASGGATTPWTFAAIAGRKEGAATYAGYLQFSTTPTNSVTAERMRIDSTGNVGIGYPAPRATLSIVGPFQYGARPAVTSMITGELHGGENADSDAGFFRISAGGGTVKSWIDLTGYSTTADANRNIVFGTNSLERMRIDSTGNVGIGTVAPGAKLDIRQSATGTGIIYVSTATTGSNYGVDSEVTGTGGTLNVGGYFAAAGATTNYAINIPASNPIAGANNYAIYSAAQAQSYFAGNVGIGTTSPGQRLEVGAPSGSPATSGTTQNGMLRIKVAGSVTGLDMGVYTDSPYGSWMQSGFKNDLSVNTPLLLNPNGGNVGIGTVSPGSYKLYVSGARAYCDQTSCWTDASSRDLKTNISQLTSEDLSSVLNQVRGTNVYYYNQINSTDGQLYLGVLSEESPDWFTTPDKKAISASAFANFLLAGMKAQQGEIDLLKAQIGRENFTVVPYETSVNGTVGTVANVSESFAPEENITQLNQRVGSLESEIALLREELIGARLDLGRANESQPAQEGPEPQQEPSIPSGLNETNGTQAGEQGDVADGGGQPITGMASVIAREGMGLVWKWIFGLFN